MKFQALRQFEEEGNRISRMLEQSIDDLSDGEVLIKSSFAAINYKDALAVSGSGKILANLPCIPGIEMSGTVVESGNSAFRPGDEVTVQGGRDFGMYRDGAYSEYVRVPGNWVAPLPAGIGLFEVVATGLAAYTSALAIEALIRQGVSPEKGEILVTGASGGSTSFAIDMLWGLGYEVVANTRKVDQTGYLKSIGASDVLIGAICENNKPLAKQRWAGAIDAVGGVPLDALLRTMKKHGVVCAFGNAAGESLSTSIYPFILREVALLGINGNDVVPERGSAWKRMGVDGDLRPRHLDKIAYTIPFSDLLTHCEKIVQGKARGRAVVQF